MKRISIKLEDQIFSETEKLIRVLGVKRSDHINEALHFYHSHYARILLKNKLAKESNLVRANLLEVLSDMELINDYGLR